MATINVETKSAVPRSIGRQLSFASAAGSAVANKLLEAHGLTLAQWAVLSCLWRNGELSVKSIAELTGNAPPAASRIVDRMVSGGLVERQPDSQDRRGVVVGLSQKGEGLRDLQDIYEQINAIMMSGLSEQERALFFDLLGKAERNGRSWLEDGGTARGVIAPPASD